VSDDVVLRIEGLEVGVDVAGATVPLVRGASLTLPRGGRVGLVGESGSGKSLTSLAVMRLNEPPTRITNGRIVLDGLDLVTATEADMRRVRGARSPGACASASSSRWRSPRSLTC
jgi:ABC-type glutathione transport system ATPase component